MELYNQNIMQALVSDLEKIKGSQIKANAVIFNLSKLQTENRNAEHINIATNILKSKMEGVAGAIYQTPANDIIVVANTNSAKLDKVIFEMQYLFGDDPVVYKNGFPNPDFAHSFDLSIEHPRFLAVCANDLGLDEIVNDKNSSPAYTNLQTLSEFVDSVIDNLVIEDFLELKETQLLTSKRIVFQNLKINLQSLRFYLSNVTDIVTNDNLFNFTREVIEMKLLLYVLKLCHSKKFSSYIMVSLSINTLDSTEFIAFDSALNDELRRKIVLSVTLGDVYKDINTSKKLAEWLHERGYFLCLEGVDAAHSIHVNRELLGFDLVRLNMNNIEGHMQDCFIDSITSQIEILGPSSIIADFEYSDVIFNFVKKCGIGMMIV